MPWFRMYYEARTDKKLGSLTDAQFRVWFNLLCFAAEQPTRGRIVESPVPILAVEVANGDADLLMTTLRRLQTLRIVHWEGETDFDGDGTLCFTHFDDRQYDKPSDAPERVSERVRRHREAKRNTDVTPVKRDETPNNALDRDRELDRDRDVVTPTSLQHVGDDAAKPLPRKRRLPDDFALTDDRIAYAVGRGYTSADTEAMFEHFRNHHTGKGSTMVDWDAAWRTWVGNQRNFAPRTTPNGNGRAKPGPPGFFTKAEEDAERAKYPWLQEQTP